jgi:hypothetical protein
VQKRNIVTCISDYKRGLDLWIRVINHLHVVTTNNYNSIADFDTKNYSTLKSSQSTFTGLYMVTALYNGYSSAMFLLDVSW